MKELRGLVISGKGRHFSSGAELDELIGFINGSVKSPGHLADISTSAFMEQNTRTFSFFSEAEFPVIAAIRGVCLGSGLELALFCHFRFCGEDAVFGVPESTYNLLPGLGGISRIKGLAGTAKAIELTLKGNTFDAREALQYGLADRIIPKREVVSFALSFASMLPPGYKKEKSSLYLRRILSNA
jgi:enoyl-CoA hydratase/carnithine racemase